MPDKLRTIIVCIITAVWAANFTAPVFVEDFAPKPELNVAFMAIVGVMVAGYNKKPPPDDKSDGGNEPE